MHRYRPPSPQAAASRPSKSQTGIKNSFPGTSSQSAQQPAAQMSSPELRNRAASLSDSKDSTPSDEQESETPSAGDWTIPRTRSGKRQRKSRELAQQSQEPRSSKSERIANILKKVAARAEKPRSGPEDVVNISSEDERTTAALSKQVQPSQSSKNLGPKTKKTKHPNRPALPGDRTNSLPDFCEFDPTKKRKHSSIIKANPARCESDSEEEVPSSPEAAGVVQGCAPPPNFGEKDDGSDSSANRNTKKPADATKAAAKSDGGKPPVPTPEKPRSQSNPEPADAVQYYAKLSVHSSSTDGSCLFYALAQSLKYLLEHYPNSFNLCRFPSRRKTMQALTDVTAMRAALVNHAKANSDVYFDNLGGLSPATSVADDYIEGGKILHDPEWYDLMCEQAQAPILNDLPTHQEIRSFHQYLQAMSKPCAHGDEIMLAMFCDLFNLRVVVVELTETSCATPTQDADLILAHTKLDITPDAPASSSFIVTLVLSSNHYDWAHLSSIQCSHPAEHCLMNEASQILCITTSPVAYIDLDPDCFTPTRIELVNTHVV